MKFRKIKNIIICATLFSISNVIALASAEKDTKTQSVLSPSSHTQNFQVIAEKNYDRGSFGEGCPMTCRLLEGPSSRGSKMRAGDTTYGFSYHNMGDFSRRFVTNALGHNSLEIGCGEGFLAKGIVNSAKANDGTQLTLVDLSKENVAALKKHISSDKKAQSIVKLCRAVDARTFLERNVKEGSFDNIGIFHVAHFWSPLEFYYAVLHMNHALKTGGTLTMTLSDNPYSIGSNYKEDSKTNRWCSSPCSSPAAFSTELKGYGGELSTTLPPEALGNLLEVLGFEIIQSGYYSDGYLDNQCTKIIDRINYVGITAKKVREAQDSILWIWHAHAAQCEDIKGLTSISSDDSAYFTKQMDFSKADKSLWAVRERELFHSVKKKK